MFYVNDCHYWCTLSAAALSVIVCSDETFSEMLNATLSCMLLKAFSAVFFAHPLAQVHSSLKTQGLRVQTTPEA